MRKNSGRPLHLPGARRATDGCVSRSAEAEAGAVAIAALAEVEAGHGNGGTAARACPPSVTPSGEVETNTMAIAAPVETEPIGAACEGGAPLRPPLDDKMLRPMREQHFSSFAGCHLFDEVGFIEYWSGCRLSMGKDGRPRGSAAAPPRKKDIKTASSAPCAPGA